MACNRHNFFVILVYFLLFYLSNNPENQNLEKMKKKTHLETSSFYKSVKKPLFDFHVPIHLLLFLFQNYKKIFKSRSRVLRTWHFRAHSNPFTLNKTFFAKITNINFIYLLAPFTVQNFKKSLEHIQSFEKAL